MQEVPLRVILIHVDFDNGFSRSEVSGYFGKFSCEAVQRVIPGCYNHQFS
jgi:hypothetical protein